MTPGGMRDRQPRRLRLGEHERHYDSNLDKRKTLGAQDLRSTVTPRGRMCSACPVSGVHDSAPVAQIRHTSTTSQPFQKGARPRRWRSRRINTSEQREPEHVQRYVQSKSLFLESMPPSRRRARPSAHNKRGQDNDWQHARSKPLCPESPYPSTR